MSRSVYHLVHANLAFMRAPLDDPVMADFVAQVDKIDALAHASPGFVAQPTPSDEGVVFTGNDLLNLSIWESVESLHEFTYHGHHARALEQRAAWFEQRDGLNYVLFWVLASHIPTEQQVKQRLDHLRQHGPTPVAFTFERRFTVEEMLAYDVDNP